VFKLNFWYDQLKLNTESAVKNIVKPRLIKSGNTLIMMLEVLQTRQLCQILMKLGVVE